MPTPRMPKTLSSVLALALVAAPRLQADGRLVKDVQPGPESGLFHHEVIIAPPQVETSFLAAAGGVLYFSADDGIHGAELWRSDGTGAGTRLVKDIRSGPESSLALGHAPPSAVLDGDFYFLADDGAHGLELWRSDGTGAGTRLVKDIRPGPGSPRIRSLRAGGSALYFAAEDGIHGQGLWRSDGTEAGTSLLRAFGPTTTLIAIGHLAFAGGALYFGANDGATGMELWKSDGTPEGTVMVKDIEPGARGSGPVIFDVDLGNTVLFRAQLGGLGTPGFGSELWKTDGTEAGTVMVKDIQEGDQSSMPKGFVTVAGKHFFVAASEPSDASGRLLMTDGTRDGTVRVELPEPIDETPLGLLGAAGPRLFLIAAEQLWSHDASTGATEPLFDLSERSIEAYGTRGEWLIWISRGDPGARREIWASDGTPQRVALVSRYAQQAHAFQPQLLALVEDRVFFAPFDPDLGRELWAADLGPLFAGSVTTIPALGGLGRLLLAVLLASCGALLLRRVC